MKLTDNSQWQKLKEHYEDIKQLHIQKIFGTLETNL